jgi:hypothetical protein
MNQERYHLLEGMDGIRLFLPRIIQLLNMDINGYLGRFGRPLSYANVMNDCYVLNISIY